MSVIGTRNERVVLSLTDSGFSTGMAKAAGQAAALDRALDGIDGDQVRVARSAKTMNTEVDKSAAAFRQGGKDIDRYSGRLALLGKAATALGPTLAPLAVAAVPTLSALAAGLGAAAGGVGTLVLAFHGLGDAFEALNDFQAERTAENLAAMRAEFERVGPAAEQFIRFIDSLSPELERLQMTARDGLLPGLQEGIEALMQRLPEMRALVVDLSATMGDLATDAGDAIASDRWQPFFDYLRTDASSVLEGFSRSLGLLTEGLLNLMAGLGPLTQDFIGSFERMSRSFAEWSRTLAQNDGFQGFIDYVREVVPQVSDFLGSLGTAFGALMQAVAPFGSAMLQILTPMLDVFAAIASSPIGDELYAMAAGLAAISLTATGLRAAATALGLIGANGLLAGRGLAAMTAQAGAVAAFGIAASTAAESMGLTNTAMGSLMGILAGPWGLAIGTATGFAMDFAGTNDSVTEAIERASRAAEVGGIGFDQMSQMVEAARLELDAFKEIATADFTSKDYWLDLATGMATTKNAIEGLFGKSDVEEQEAALAELEKKLGDVGESGDDAAGATRRAAGGIGQMGGASDRAIPSIQSLTEAMDEQTAAALAAFDATTNWRRALKEARGQAGKNNRGIRDSSKAALENRDALSQVAQAWNNLNDSTNTTRRQFRHARQDFINVAQSMGVPRERARELADELLEIPDRVKTEIAVEDRNAKKKTEVHRQAMEGMDGEVATAILKADNKDARRNTTEAEQWAERYALGKYEAILRGDAAPAQGAADSAKGSAIDFANGNYVASLDGDPSGTQAAYNTGISLLNSFDGRTATAYINTVHTTTGGGTSGFQQFASGGYTGRGEKYEPAGVVHRDEVVLPREVVRSDASHLRERYGFLPGMQQLPGFADGGLVGLPGYANGGKVNRLPAGALFGQGGGAFFHAFTRGLIGAERALNGIERAMDRSKNSIEREREERDEARDAFRDARQDRRSFAQGITGDLRSNLFAASEADPVWAAGGKGSVVDPFAALRSDISTSREQMRLQRKLVGKAGLSDDAFQEALESGGIDALRTLGGMSPSELSRFQRMFATRQRVTQQAGRRAGQAVLGDEVQVARRHLALAQSEVKTQARQHRAQMKRLRSLERTVERMDKNQSANRTKNMRGAARAASGRR